MGKSLVLLILFGLMMSMTFSLMFLNEILVTNNCPYVITVWGPYDGSESNYTVMFPDTTTTFYGFNATNVSCAVGAIYAWNGEWPDGINSSTQAPNINLFDDDVVESEPGAWTLMLSYTEPDFFIGVAVECLYTDCGNISVANSTDFPPGGPGNSMLWLNNVPNGVDLNVTYCP